MIIYKILYGMRCARFRKTYNNFYGALAHDKINMVILSCFSASRKIPLVFHSSVAVDSSEFCDSSSKSGFNLTKLSMYSSEKTLG